MVQEGNTDTRLEGDNNHGRGFFSFLAPLVRHKELTVAVIGIAGALITVSPQIMAAVVALREGIPAAQVPFAAKRQAFIAEAVANGYACVSSEEFYYDSPSEVRIDATLCEETGDIFLRINAPEAGRHISVVFLEDHLKAARPARREVSAGWLRAHAAATAAAPLPRDAAGAGPLRLAQVLVQTLCQRIDEDERTLIRRVRQGAECFEERWDTFTGELVSSEPIPCDPNCG